MKILITEEQYKSVVNEQEQPDYGLVITKKGNYFYLILIEGDGSVAGYIRMYRNKEKGFSRDTFAAKSGIGKYMLMFNFAVAAPHPVTVDRSGGTNTSAFKALSKFIKQHNVKLEPIPKDSADYIEEGITDYQKKYQNVYMYASPDRSFLNEFLNNGKTIIDYLQISENELIQKAEAFFQRRYAGEST